MKLKIIPLFLVVVLLLISCNDDENTSPKLVSSWELIENLLDPGGGNGTYQSVESDKIIEFYNDGTIRSNGILCDMSISSDNPSSGTYSSFELIFNTSSCTNTELDYNYEINGSTLIVKYPCFEPCRSKYSRIE